MYHLESFRLTEKAVSGKDEERALAVRREVSHPNTSGLDSERVKERANYWSFTQLGSPGPKFVDSQVDHTA